MRRPASFVLLALAVSAAGGPRDAAAALCLHKRTKVLRLRERCRGNETLLEALQFGAKGEKGNTGDVGLRGPKGDAGDMGLRGLKGDPGPSNAYSVHRETPVDVADDTPATVAELPIPLAGNYVLVAKAWVRNLDGTAATLVVCELNAEGRTDTTVTRLEPAQGGENANRAALAFNLVHEFDTPGSALLQCNDDGPANAQIGDIRITAIRVDELVNTPLP